MNRLTKILLALSLLLLGSYAWAAASPITVNLLPAMHSLNAHDLSVAYLGQLFGRVGLVLHGSAGQMMGHLFEKFNEGLVVLATLWLGYTTLFLTISSVAGGMNSQKPKFYMIGLRIVIGISLLAPLPSGMAGTSGGYDGFQTITMEVVIQGVRLADNVWDYGLNYLNNGGLLYLPPTTSSNSSTDQSQGNSVSMQSGTGYTQTFMPAWNLAAAALQYQTCSDLSALNSSQIAGMPTPNASNVIDFPSYNKTGNTASGCGTLSPSSVFSASFTGSSGNEISMCDSTTSAGQALCSSEMAAVESAVEDTDAQAQDIACAIDQSKTGACSGTPTTTTALSSDTATALSNAIIDIKNALLPVLNFNNSLGALNQSTFIQAAKSQGWIMAGRYYWDLAMLNDYSQTSGVNDLSSVLNGNLPATSSTAVTGSTFTPPVKAPSSAPGANAGTIVSNTLGKLSVYNQTQQASIGAGRGATDHTDLGGNTLVDMLLSLVTGGLVVALAKVATSLAHIGANPIELLHHLGMLLLNAAGAVWFAMTMGILAVYGIGFICSGTQPAGFALRGVVNWIKPVLIALLAALCTSGIMLAYYVPLYPYILFTFACIGWFILVIESMIAAPLIALGLTHPEGHDFMGKAEQGLMLLLSVFLRPTLMIIGLLAGMILSYVALSMIDYGFGAVVKSLFYSNALMTTYGSILGVGKHTLINGISSLAGTGALNGSTSLGSLASLGSSSVSVPSAAMEAMAGGLMKDTNPGAMLFTLVGVPTTIYVIFAMVVKSAVNQCFSAIHVIPSNIFRWIGGPMMSGNVEQQAQSIRGGGTARQMGSAAGQNAGGDQGMHERNAEASAKGAKEEQGLQGAADDSGTSDDSDSNAST